MTLRHPVILNSADSAVDWVDLSDRSILVQMPDLKSIDRHFINNIQQDCLLQASFNSLMWLLSYVDRQWFAFDGESV